MSDDDGYSGSFPGRCEGHGTDGQVKVHITTCETPKRGCLGTWMHIADDPGESKCRPTAELPAGYHVRMYGRACLYRASRGRRRAAAEAKTVVGGVKWCLTSRFPPSANRPGSAGVDATDDTKPYRQPFPFCSASDFASAWPPGSATILDSPRDSCSRRPGQWQPVLVEPRPPLVLTPSGFSRALPQPPKRSAARRLQSDHVTTLVVPPPLE